MAHHKSTIKRIKTSAEANLRNRHYRSTMRSAIRQVNESSDPEDRLIKLRRANAILDRMSAKGIIHRNTAARRKSRLTKFVTRENG